MSVGNSGLLSITTIMVRMDNYLMTREYLWKGVKESIVTGLVGVSILFVGMLVGLKSRLYSNLFFLYFMFF